MRNQNIELSRIISAFGIVLFHSGAPGHDAGYAGLVVFTILSTYYTNSNFAKLSQRILIPYFVWTIFYVLWRFAADGHPFHEGMSPLQSILYGTHLWFLPFIFIVNLILSRIESRYLPLIGAVLAFGLLVATPWWREVQLSFAPPIVQFLHAIAAALLGVAYRTRTGMIISAFGLAICVLWQVPGVSLPYGLGGFVVLAALLLPRMRYNVESVSVCTFGIYLVHIAALGVFNRITGQGSITTVCSTFVASLIGVWLVRRYMPMSRAVLG